jgi:hypothetical protein
MIDVRRLSVLSLALVLAACGSSSPSAPSTPQRRVVAQGQFVGLPSSNGGNTNTINATFAATFTTTSAGTIDAIVDWTFATNQIGVGLYPGTCTSAQLGFGNCIVLVQSNSSAKPGKLTFAAPAGTYSLAFENLGPGSESGTYQVGVTY